MVKHHIASKYDHDCLQNLFLLFMSWLTARIVKNNNILVRIYFIFLQKRPKSNFFLFIIIAILSLILIGKRFFLSHIYRNRLFRPLKNRLTSYVSVFIRKNILNSFLPWSKSSETNPWYKLLCFSASHGFT